jgi:type II secretory pathway pseudopilin PulG
MKGFTLIQLMVALVLIGLMAVVFVSVTFGGSMKTFSTYEEVDGMRECKKSALAHAKQIDIEFRVESLEGNYKQGKAGDYLMTGVEGEHYICDQEIFKKTYDFI